MISVERNYLCDVAESREKFYDQVIMIEKQWCYQPIPTDSEVEALQSILKTPAMVTKLLWQRGVRNLSTAQSFFNPSLEALHDPFQMKDMHKAVARLWQAIDKQERICVYGDYDVDGTTSVALLYGALKKLGAKHVTFYIPARHGEGYGVSSKGITHAVNEGVDLLVCVDCSTRAVGPLSSAYAQGIETIVCDHHEVGERVPPTVAMLNPKREDCPYPFKGLSACGIVFKLLQAMVQDRGLPENLTPYLDLVALSIAADIVPMVGENRLLMYHGLVQLNEAPRPGVQALKEGRKQEQPFTVSDVVFGIAPSINAVGRMSHAAPAVKLLLTEDRKAARSWADTLASQNVSRKQLDEQMTQEALDLIASQPPNESIVLCKEGWSKGIVGIVAARCVAHYHRPTIILTKERGMLTGSGRSVPGYNLYQAVHACAPLLARYGGHAQAVGLSLPEENLAAFTAKFEEKVRATLLPVHKQPTQKIDLRIKLAELTPATCRLLARMAPFGPGHRQPVFATLPVRVHAYKIYQEKHVKIFFTAEDNEMVWDAIGFDMASLFLSLYKQTDRMAIAYKASLDRFQGVERIQLMLKDMKLMPNWVTSYSLRELPEPLEGDTDES